MKYTSVVTAVLGLTTCTAASYHCTDFVVPVEVEAPSVEVAFPPVCEPARIGCFLVGVKLSKRILSERFFVVQR